MKMIASKIAAVEQKEPRESLIWFIFYRQVSVHCTSTCDQKKEFLELSTPCLFTTFNHSILFSLLMANRWSIRWNVNGFSSVGGACVVVNETSVPARNRLYYGYPRRRTGGGRLKRFYCWRRRRPAGSFDLRSTVTECCTEADLTRFVIPSGWSRTNNFSKSSARQLRSINKELNNDKFAISDKLSLTIWSWTEIKRSVENAKRRAEEIQYWAVEIIDVRARRMKI